MYINWGKVATIWINTVSLSFGAHSSSVMWLHLNLTFLCMYLSGLLFVCLSSSFSLPNWMLFLVRHIYYSPIPLELTSFFWFLNLYSYSFLICYIFDCSHFFVTHSFIFFLLTFHLLSINQFFFSLFSQFPQPHLSHIFSFCHLCGPVLLMYCCFCVKLDCLLDSLASEARRYLVQILSLAEPQNGAKWLQTCVLVKQSWVKDLRTPCLLMHTGELRVHELGMETAVGA